MTFTRDGGKGLFGPIVRNGQAVWWERLRAELQTCQSTIMVSFVSQRLNGTMGRLDVLAGL